MASRWDETDAGCILAGSSHRTADELSADTVLLACDSGWDSHGGARQDAESLYSLAPHPGGGYWFDDPDASDALDEAAAEAVEWLNGHIAPYGHCFVIDDGLYLYADDDSDR